MAEEALKAAKTDRRTAKGTLTRCGKSLAKLIEAKRPEQEVRDGLSKLQLAFDTLVEKHENYSAYGIPRNETKQNEMKRNETKRNETKPNQTKRND